MKKIEILDSLKIDTVTENIPYSGNKYSPNYLSQTCILYHFIKNMSKVSFNNILLDIDTLLDNLILHLIVV